MITGIGIYLGIGLIWVLILEASIDILPDDELDTETVIYNMLLWPMIIVYLYREWKNRH